MKEPAAQAWYCKAKKKTGKPVEILTKGMKKPKNKRSFTARGCLEVRMAYNNAPAIARKSGATTVLKVYKLPPSACHSG